MRKEVEMMTKSRFAVWKQTQVQDRHASGKRMSKTPIWPPLGEAANLSGLAERRQSALRELLQLLLELVDDVGVDEWRP
jgi:hypothetical protein